MATRVSLCQTQLNRMPAEAPRLIESLTAAGAEVERMQCLSLCFGCSQQVVARVDGAPVGAPTAEALAQEIRNALVA